VRNTPDISGNGDVLRINLRKQSARKKARKMLKRILEVIVGFFPLKYKQMHLKPTTTSQN